MPLSNPLAAFIHKTYIFTLFEDNNQLCFQQYDATSNNLLEEGILVSPFNEEFALVSVDNNLIHLVALGETLAYRCWDNGWSEEVCVYPYAAKISNLVITALGNLAHIAYVDNGHNNLIHQYGNSSGWSNPSIIYTFPGICKKIALEQDASGDLHLMVEEENENTCDIKHFIRNAYTNRWLYQGNSEKENNANRHSPHLLVDQFNNVHFTWLETTPNKSFVCYRRYRFNGWPSNGWEAKRILFSLDREIVSPSLIKVGNQLIALWSDGGSFYYCGSADRGLTWDEVKSKPNLTTFIKAISSQGELELPRSFSTGDPNPKEMVYAEINNFDETYQNSISQDTKTSLPPNKWRNQSSEIGLVRNSSPNFPNGQYELSNDLLVLLALFLFSEING